MTKEEKLYGNNYQLRYEELKKKYNGLVALNRATLEEYDEQEKIIELMAFELATEDENYLYRSIDDIIECFKKKAKGD